MNDAMEKKRYEVTYSLTTSLLGKQFKRSKKQIILATSFSEARETVKRNNKEHKVTNITVEQLPPIGGDFDGDRIIDNE